MRVLHTSFCILLIAISLSQGSHGLCKSSEISPSDGVVSGILDQAKTTALLTLMKTHFGLSMNYLLTSKRFASQYEQRSGLAKYLNEASNHHWEEGMDVLKKFLQRGGKVDSSFKDFFLVEGRLISGEYIEVMKRLLNDSKDLTLKMNKLHYLAGKDVVIEGTEKKTDDAEIAHYLDSKLEKEAEVARELAGKINILGKMKDSGVAMNIFDSDL